MLRISRLTSLAAGTLVLSLPVFAACGGDDGGDGVELDTWTAGLCDSVTSWLEDVETLSDFEIDADSTPEDVKAVMVEFLTDVDERTKEFKSDIDGLGVPDTGDGEEIQAAFSAAADGVVKIFGDALADAEALDASDDEVLATQLVELGEAITAASEEVGDAFAQIDEDFDTTEISEAARDIPECEGMFAT